MPFLRRVSIPGQIDPLSSDKDIDDEEVVLGVVPTIDDRAGPRPGRKLALKSKSARDEEELDEDDGGKRKKKSSSDDFGMGEEEEDSDFDDVDKAVRRKPRQSVNDIEPPEISKDAAYGTSMARSKRPVNTQSVARRGSPSARGGGAAAAGGGGVVSATGTGSNVSRAPFPSSRPRAPPPPVMFSQPKATPPIPPLPSLLPNRNGKGGGRGGKPQ